MLGNFWVPYDGNLLMETFRWKIQVDARGFSMGVIMAQCYSIMLWFQGNRALVEHPGSADLSRTMQSKVSEVIGRLSRGMEMLNQMGNRFGHGG